MSDRQLTSNQKKARFQLLQEDNALALKVTSQQDEDSPWGDAGPAQINYREVSKV